MKGSNGNKRAGFDPNAIKVTESLSLWLRWVLEQGHGEHLKANLTFHGEGKPKTWFHLTCTCFSLTEVSGSSKNFALCRVQPLKTQLTFKSEPVLKCQHLEISRHRRCKVIWLCLRCMAWLLSVRHDVESFLKKGYFVEGTQMSCFLDVKC